MSDPQLKLPPDFEPESRRDAIPYVVASVILIGGGSVLRTPILNWICGPAIVVAVAVLFDRKRSK